VIALATLVDIGDILIAK